MLNIRVDIKGLDGVFRRLDRIDNSLSDRSPFFREAGAEVMASSGRTFRAGGRPKWKPLTETTVLLRSRGARRHKRGGNKGRVTKASFDTLIAGMRPLRDTGLLMASVGVPSRGGVFELGKDYVRVGTALRQAAIQQFGGTTKGMIPGKKIPPRPFIGLTEGEKPKVFSMALRFVKKAVEKNK